MKPPALAFVVATRDLATPLPRISAKHWHRDPFPVSSISLHSPRFLNPIIPVMRAIRFGVFSGFESEIRVFEAAATLTARPATRCAVQRCVRDIVPVDQGGSAVAGPLVGVARVLAVTGQVAQLQTDLDQLRTNKRSPRARAD